MIVIAVNVIAKETETIVTIVIMDDNNDNNGPNNK